MGDHTDGRSWTGNIKELCKDTTHSFNLHLQQLLISLFVIQFLQNLVQTLEKPQLEQMRFIQEVNLHCLYTDICVCTEYNYFVYK